MTLDVFLVTIYYLVFAYVDIDPFTRSYANMLLAARATFATALSNVLDDWTKKRLDLQLVTSA